MKYKIKVYSIYEFGHRKDAAGNPHQEDCTYPLHGRLSDSDRTFILCDGMGGHDAGEVASATVCEAMGHSIHSDGHDADGIFTEKDFLNALDAAYNALDKKDNGAAKKMGTTMTFLKLHNQGATIAHIGDSRVYHIRPGKTGKDTKILFETSDHSLVNDLIKVGELTREEARLSNQKNVITRAMQPHLSPRPKADIHTTADIRPGDYFYLCSDGMLEQDDMENGTTLRNIFSSQGGDDDNKVEILRSVTDDNNDNHTAIIVHILDVTDNKPVAARPKSDRMATVSDSEVSAASAAPVAVRRPSRGKSALIAFFIVAACVAAVIFFMKKGDDDKKTLEEVRPQTEKSAGTVPEKTKVNTPTPTKEITAPAPAEEIAAPASSAAPVQKPAEKPATATPAAQPDNSPSKPAVSADEISKIGKKFNPPAKSDDGSGVTESDQSKIKKINPKKGE